MKDMLLIFPAVISFVAGYFIMKKIEELLEFFQKGSPSKESDKQVKSFYPFFGREKAAENSGR